jgi:putative transcriptional regulator
VAALQFEAETPVAMKNGALDAVLARLTEDPFQEQATRAPCRRAAEAAGTVITEVLALPIQVRELALEAIGQGSWVFGGPGLRSLPLAVPGPSKAELLRIEPGWGAPRHSHKGGEYTLVITGAFTDERGTYRVGDVAVAGPDVTHRPVAQKGGVCYALAVTEAPLAMTGALGFLQRVWRH